jgi:hypothetical protein
LFTYFRKVLYGTSNSEGIEELANRVEESENEPTYEEVVPPQAKFKNIFEAVRPSTKGSVVEENTQGFSLIKNRVRELCLSGKLDC